MKYLAVLLLLLFGVWAYLLPGKDDMPNQAAVRYELKINGTAPGQVELRMLTSSNIPPTYVNCSTMTLSDASWAPALTTYGRSKFEVPDDVQDAIDAAVAEAIEDILGQDFTACAGAGGDDPEYPPCSGLTGGAVTETVNDATVTAQVYWSTGSFDEVNPGDEWYDECGEGGSSLFSSRLKLDITAPQKPGVDLRSVLEGISIGYAPLDEVISNILAGDTVFPAGIDGVSVSDAGGIPGAVLTVGWGGGGGSIQITRYDGIGFQAAMAITTYSTSSVVGDTVTVTDNVTANSRWEDEFANSTSIPFGFPSDFELTVQDNSPLTINLEIPFTNNWDEPDPTKWHLATDYQPDDSDIVRSSGHLLASAEYTTTLKDPGFRSYCQWDCTYVNRRPFLAFCGENEMQLNVYHANGFVHPIGKFPACKIMVKALKTEDV